MWVVAVDVEPQFVLDPLGALGMERSRSLPEEADGIPHDDFDVALMLFVFCQPDLAY